MTANNYLFNNMNNTVKILKTVAKDGVDKTYSVAEIKQLLTIEQWRHVVFLMKVLQLSESVSDTGNIAKFTKSFCHKIFRYNYNDLEESDKIFSRFPECFYVALYQASKITMPIVHLAEIMARICYRNIEAYESMIHEMIIDKHFYDNYLPCECDFDCAINRISAQFVKKYVTMPNGLIMLDNAIVTNIIMNDCFTDFNVSCKVVETIQEHLLNYAKAINNVNVYYVVKQYSDLYNIIAENIIYHMDFVTFLKRSQKHQLSTTIAVKRAVDFNDPIHETIFNYSKDMQFDALRNA